MPQLRATMKNSIIFFGTSNSSLEILRALAKSFAIEAVFSRSHSPVLAWAKANEVKFFTPSSTEDLAAIFRQHEFQSNIGIVVDYGLIIPKTVIESMDRGIVNVHYSLLPALRGANPVRAAILEGHKRTGVSIMLITPALDDGDILAQKAINLNDQITAPELKAKLTNLAIEMLEPNLNDYLAENISPLPQKKLGKPTYTSKVSKADGLIDWQKSATTLTKEIRAYSDWPGSYTRLGDKQVIITKTKVGNPEPEIRKKPGDWFEAEDKQLAVLTGHGLLIIEKLKPAGKKEMTGQEFIRGYLKNR